MEQEFLIFLTITIGLSSTVIITFIILKLLENKRQNNQKDNTDNGSNATVEASFTKPNTHDSNSSDYSDGNGNGD
jgi:uncharacterized membrane-anchored protein YhcB (DUF1043 family)